METTRTRARIAVIGGSGLYEIKDARVVEEIDVPTPWGMPSDVITIAEIGSEPVAFLPRHGRGHRFTPSEVPSRANIWALKSLGVEQIVSVSAVGSLSRGFHPGELVLCDNLIDRTVRRPSTFFGDGVVGHVPFAEPFCSGMRETLGKVIATHGHPFHETGTYVCMEGPAFSTRAESDLHRSWRAALIGMTASPEAKLAREAEICYATVAMITDYDCWAPSEEGVSVDMVLQTMTKSVAAVRSMIPDFVAALGPRGDCPCRHAAENAIMTDPSMIPYDARRRLSLFYGRYWKKG
ncbi:MAG TPA: S-methyl-5'-thioadenosine phosphorylase [Spirochaetia bacterium]